MALIIDGYNLLNASGVFGRGRGPKALEQSRMALLDFLAEYLDPDELSETRIAFDAKDAPPGLPRESTYRGLTVQYAARHKEADDLIEELIRAESAPRKLTVVSSDHRLQRAARRRKATAIDSDAWIGQVVARRRERERAVAEADVKPKNPQAEHDVTAWLQKFGDADVCDLDARPDAASDMKESDDVDGLDELANPFPPGYGEDVLADED
jgi:predicted RNA-binding protein with PIN domain